MSFVNSKVLRIIERVPVRRLCTEIYLSCPIKLRMRKFHHSRSGAIMNFNELIFQICRTFIIATCLITVYYIWISICIYMHYMCIRIFHKLYIYIYSIYAIYLHKFGKKILHAFSFFFFFEKRRWNFVFNYICVSSNTLQIYVILGKIQFFLYLTSYAIN